MDLSNFQNAKDYETDWDYLDKNLVKNKNELYLPCKKGSRYCALLLFPDDNDPIFSSEDRDLIQRIEYMSMEYHIYLKRVRDLQQAIDKSFEVSDLFKICHMELGGHGTAKTLHWPRQVIEVGKERDLLSILFSFVCDAGVDESGVRIPGSILTLSCYNGKKTKGQNILEYFHTIAEDKKVIGTKCANGKHLSLVVSCARPLKLDYFKEGNLVSVVHLPLVSHVC
jgi:hypothetical protein